jgi:uncharacterized membrane protein
MPETGIPAHTDSGRERPAGRARPAGGIRRFFKRNLIAGLLALAPLGVSIWVVIMVWNHAVVPVGGWTSAQIARAVPEVVDGERNDGQSVPSVTDEPKAAGKSGLRPATKLEIFLARVFRPPAPRHLEMTIAIDGKEQSISLSPEAQRAMGMDPQPAHWVTYVIGFVMVLALALLFGIIVRMVLGRAILRLADKVVERIPIVKGLYTATRQLLGTLFTDSERKFQGTVLVQFPRPGSWTLAFITGSPSGQLLEGVGGGDAVSVFVPTTPNPTSGFLLMVPRGELRPVSMSVEEALKYIISGGIVPPK